MNPKAGKVSQIAQSAGKSYAYLLGVYLGDGSIFKVEGKYPAFRMNTIDKDFADAVKCALDEISGYTTWIGKPKQDKRFSQSRPLYHLKCSIPKDLHERMDKDTATKTAIPSWMCHDASIEEKHAFIVGLMDSEGYVAENRSSHTNRRFFMGFKVCDPWIYTFKLLLESCGIKTNKVRSEKPRKEWYKTPRVFTIKMQSWIDRGLRFNIKRKNDRVDTWASAPAYAQRKLNPRRLTSETTRSAPVKGDDIVRSGGESARGVEKSAPATV